MVGSFVRFFFTRCEESLNSLSSLVARSRWTHSFAALTRSFAPLATREEKSSALTYHEVTSIYHSITGTCIPRSDPALNVSQLVFIFFHPLVCVSGYLESGEQWEWPFLAVFIWCHHKRHHKAPLSIFVSPSKPNRQGKFCGDIVFSLTNTALWNWSLSCQG